MGLYKYVIDEGRTRPEHIVVWEKANGKKVPEGYDIHHIDFNGKNNDPSNLVALPHSDHLRLHHKLRREGKDLRDKSDPEFIEAQKKRHELYLKNKQHHREYKRKYRAEHADEIRVQHHENYVRTKEHCSEVSKKYRESHKEQIRAAGKAYRETHKEQIAEKDRRYRLKNAEKISEKCRVRYQEKKEEIKAQHKAYRESHVEERKAYNQQYREKHRELIRAKGRLYSAITNGLPQDVIDARRKEVETLKNKERSSE